MAAKHKPNRDGWSFTAESWDGESPNLSATVLGIAASNALEEIVFTTSALAHVDRPCKQILPLRLHLGLPFVPTSKSSAPAIGKPL